MTLNKEPGLYLFSCNTTIRSHVTNKKWFIHVDCCWFVTKSPFQIPHRKQWAMLSCHTWIMILLVQSSWDRKMCETEQVVLKENDPSRRSCVEASTLQQCCRMSLLKVDPMLNRGGMVNNDMDSNNTNYYFSFKTTGPAVTTIQFVRITVFGELYSWILVPSVRATEATFMSLDL